MRAVLLFLLLFAMSSIAFADQPQSTVFFNDGTILHGHVMEDEDPAFVLVSNEKGDARYARDRIRTIRDNTPPIPPHTIVTIDANESDTWLETFYGEKYVRVCIAPCGKEVRLGWTYRLAGPNLLSSRDFVLDAPKEVTLIVGQMGKRSTRKTGNVVMAVGLGILALGAGLTAALIVDHRGCYPCEMNGALLSTTAMALLAGFTTLGIGALISWVATTHVEVH